MWTKEITSWWQVEKGHFPTIITSPTQLFALFLPSQNCPWKQVQFLTSWPLQSLVSKNDPQTQKEKLTIINLFIRPFLSSQQPYKKTIYKTGQKTTISYTWSRCLYFSPLFRLGKIGLLPSQLTSNCFDLLCTWIEHRAAFRFNKSWL